VGEIGPELSMHEADEKCTQNFVGKRENNLPLVKHKCRCQDNIAVDLKDMWCEVN